MVVAKSKQKIRSSHCKEIDIQENTESCEKKLTVSRGGCHHCYLNPTSRESQASFPYSALHPRLLISTTGGLTLVTGCVYQCTDPTTQAVSAKRQDHLDPPSTVQPIHHPAHVHHRLQWGREHLYDENPVELNATTLQQPSQILRDPQ